MDFEEDFAESISRLFEEKPAEACSMMDFEDEFAGSISRLFEEEHHDQIHMAEFTDLPSELVAEVCKYISAADFDSLRQASRSIYQRAGSYLSQHRGLQRRFTPTIIHGIFSGNPNHASYIRSLNVYQWYGSYRNRTDMNGVMQHRAFDTWAFLDEDETINAMLKLDHLPSDEVEHWKRAIRNGEQAPLISLLLLLSPNLETLRLTKIESFGDLFTDTLVHAAKSPRTDILSQLTAVYVSFRDYRASFCLLTAFAKLPSVKVIHFHGIDAEQARKLMPLSSNVVDLSLRNARITPALIAYFLSFCPKLKALEYTQVPDSTTLIPPISKAKKNSIIYADVLEKLVYRDNIRDASHYAYLLGSRQALLDLEIEFDVALLGRNRTTRPEGLYRNTHPEGLDSFPERITNFIEVLPASLEKITLRYKIKDNKIKDFGHFATFLTELCRSKSRLPHLKRVHFQKCEEELPLRESSVQPGEYSGNYSCVVEGSSISSLKRLRKLPVLGVTVTSDSSIGLEEQVEVDRDTSVFLERVNEDTQCRWAV